MERKEKREEKGGRGREGKEGRRQRVRQREREREGKRGRTREIQSAIAGQCPLSAVLTPPIVLSSHGVGWRAGAALECGGHGPSGSRGLHIRADSVVPDQCTYSGLSAVPIIACLASLALDVCNRAQQHDARQDLHWELRGADAVGRGACRVRD